MRTCFHKIFGIRRVVATFTLSLASQYSHGPFAPYLSAYLGTSMTKVISTMKTQHRWQLQNLDDISTTTILIVSLILRIAFFLFGLYQDANMPLPYTDIDYYVFTDAANFVAHGLSPYLRATYRYTPLLSWLLVPTAFEGVWWFSFGKFIFILCDLLTGYICIITLPKRKKYLSLIWMFNPMVITISTRGSSESLLTSVILLSAYYLTKSGKSIFNVFVSGLLLGISIHLKIYPFIYVPTFLLYIDSRQTLLQPLTMKRITFAVGLLLGFASLTYWMIQLYGDEYIKEAWLYHATRLDHRHNFSIYNVPLYLSSALKSSRVSLESLAFVPQMGLSLIVIPLALKAGFNCGDNEFKNGILFKIIFIQTFIFIVFNKVCTSQYFIWFLCILPQFLVGSTLISKRGLVMLIGWIVTQGWWLFNGWRLEFKGVADIFVSGLFASASLFFVWNIYMIGEFIGDVSTQIAAEGERRSVQKDR